MKCINCNKITYKKQIIGKKNLILNLLEKQYARQMHCYLAYLSLFYIGNRQQIENQSLNTEQNIANDIVPCEAVFPLGTTESVISESASQDI